MRVDAPPLGGWEAVLQKKVALQKLPYLPLTPKGELNPHRQVMKGIVSF